VHGLHPGVDPSCNLGPKIMTVTCPTGHHGKDLVGQGEEYERNSMVATAVCECCCCFQFGNNLQVQVKKFMESDLMLLL
jgi:hypothetical protein